MKSVVIGCKSIALALCLCLSVSAQTVNIGGLGAKGCQNSDDPPTLSDGNAADGTLTYSYDGVLKRLTLVAHNTTTMPDPSWRTPTITSIGFNFPASVTGTSLVSQTGSGGATPNWSLSAGTGQQGGCFGTFSRILTAGGPGIQNGIAKPGTIPGGPPNSAVIGPMTFVIQITTAAALTAQDFIDSQSTGGAYSATAAFGFQGSGPNGQGSGFIGSQPSQPVCTDVAIATDLGPSCNIPLDPILYANPPIIGQVFNLCMDGDPGFANGLGFWFGSLPPVTPWTDPVSGCTVYVDVFNPANFILINTFFLDANGDWCLPIPLPDLPALVGLELIFQLRICAPGGPQGPLDPDWLTNGLYVKIGCI